MPVKAEEVSERELMFSSPMTLSAFDAARIREQLTDMISRVAKIVDPSPAEEFWSFNIDFLREYGQDGSL